MSKSLVLLSGENTTIPEAEARSIFLAYDPASRFTSPEKQVLIAESNADPGLVARRVAFARRVGVLLDNPLSAAGMVKGKKVRLRVFSAGRPTPNLDAETVLRGVDAEVD